MIHNIETIKKYYSLLPIKPYIVNGKFELINDLSKEQLQRVLDIKKKYYDLSKRVNDQYQYWDHFNSLNGNQIQELVKALSDLQIDVCNTIGKMKKTWEDVADSGSFDEVLEKELNNEDSQFSDLETDVNTKLNPYKKAQEFLSWTIATIDSTSDIYQNSTYPEEGFDDIVLEEYLDGSV